MRAAILRRLSDQIVEAASREHSPEAEALAGELAAKAPANALTAAMLDMLIGEMTLKSSPDLDISVPAPAPKPHLREWTASVRRVGPYGRPVPPEMLKQTKAFEHRDGAKSLSRDRSKPKLPHRADSRRARDPRYDQDSRPTTFHKEQKRAYPEHTDTGRRGYKPHERSAQDLRPRKPAKQHR